MESLKKRTPFTPDEDEGRVLDEQEQETVVNDLREANNASTRQQVGALKVILALSMFLQILSFFRNPLLVIFPLTSAEPSVNIPLPAAFTVFSIIMHINLGLIVFRDEIRSRYNVSETTIYPLPYQLSYAMVSIPLTLSLLLRRPWQVSTWWGVTVVLLVVVHTTTSSIIQGDESVSELDSLRYRSPGA